MTFRKLLALGATATLLTGCAMGGGAPQSSAPAVAQSATSTTSGKITVWSWDVAATALKRYAATYQSSHPGTTVDVVDIGYDNAYDKISVGLQAGTGLADVITVETDRLPGYLEAFPGKFVDLTPRIGSKASDFDPSKWAAAQDASGKVFAMPWDSGTSALYLRSDYLQQAGVDPASLRTWDDFTSAAQAIKAKTGKTALDSDLSTGALFLQLLQQQGTGIFDANGDVTVNNPKAVATLTWIAKLNKLGLINNVKGWDARVSAAKAGKSAFAETAVWWAGTLKSEAPELKGKFRVQPLPVFAADDAQTTNNGGSNLTVPTQSKNPELAVDFMTYVLMDPARQTEMSEKEGLFPAYLPALSQPAFSAADPYFGGEQQLRVFADLTSKIPAISYTGDYAKASEIVANATAKAILNGEDPGKSLTDAANAVAQQTGRKVAG